MVLSGTPTVSLAPSVTEAFKFLSAEKLLVGRTDFCSLEDVPSVGSFLAPNLEVLLQLNPDLVVGTNDQSEILKRIATLGYSSLKVDHQTLGGLVQSYRDIATALKIDRSHEIAKFEEQLSSYRDLKQNDRVLYVISGDSYYLACKGSYFDSIATLLGQELVCGFESSYERVSLESLVTLKVDYIVELTENSPILGNSQFIKVPVLTITGVHHQVPGPRVFETLKLVSEFDETK